ncbi:MAG: hypothetical protein ACRDOS_06360 [Gaiellaceae bacterium]
MSRLFRFVDRNPAGPWVGPIVGLLVVALTAAALYGVWLWISYAFRD